MAKKPLFPRRQAREPSGRERSIGWILILLLAAASGLFAWSGTQPGPPGLPETQAAPAANLPVSSPGGWPRGDVESYDADTLYEKIDGKADAYLAYRFDALEFASYTSPGDGGRYVDVYLYAFETPLDAFGMYRSQWSEAKHGVEVGDEASTSGGAVFGRRGRHYAEVVPSGPAAASEALAVAEAVFERLSVDGPAVAPPRGLPAEGLVAVLFERSNALGVEALGDAFVARYADGTRVVIADAGTPDAARRAATEAADTFEFMGSGHFVEASGRYVLCVVDPPTPERAREIQRSVREGLETER